MDNITIEPKQGDFARAVDAAEHKQEEVAELLGVTRRGVQGWVAAHGKTGARACPAAAYTLYLLLTHQHPTHQITPKGVE